MTASNHGPRGTTAATLSVDSSKGRLVVDRIDSIRNLFGCELRIVHGGSGSSTAVVFAVTRLDEYDRKLPDDHLIDRLKVDNNIIMHRIK
jgi:hypothetical protein